MRFLSYLSTLLIAVLLAACGGGGGSPGAVPGGGVQTPTLTTTAPASLTLGVGSSQDFTISGGRAPYSAVTNNASVAVGGVDGSSLTLGGISVGSAEITIRDALGATSAVSVTVSTKPLFTTAPSSVTVASGSSPIYTIGGGVAPYTATSSNASVAAVSVSGANLTVTGIAVGTANVLVRDSAGALVTLAVTVPSASTLPLFTTAPASVTLAVGTSATYAIGGGSGPYTATSSNTGVASVTQGASSFTITGVANGSANLVVRDSAGSTVSVGVTVSGAQMSMNPTAVTAFIGDTVYSTISGGKAPYSVVEGFPDAADVDIGTLSGTTFTPNSSGNVLRVVVKQVVASDIILVRDATGNAVSFTLTASAGTNIISLAPSTLTIGEEFFGDIKLVLRGAVGTTHIFSSNPDMIRVTTPVTGTVPTTTVTITKTGQQICATGEVTISAIDSTGSKAVSLITVEDHGNNPDPCPPIVTTP